MDKTAPPSGNAPGAPRAGCLAGPPGGGRGERAGRGGALLGVGPDGHVCSLFAGHPLLAERKRSVAAIEDSPKPPPRRLTLTLPVLTGADLVVVVALGEGKAEIVRSALEDPRSALPVALVAQQARESLFLLDAGAARLLRGR